MDEVSFHDFDPEDAYDATDPIDTRLEMIARIAESIRDERPINPDRADIRRAGAIELVARLQIDLDEIDIKLSRVNNMAHSA